MNFLGEFAGQICKIILPIPRDVIQGNPESSVAVCTLSSMSMLREIASSDLLSRIAIAGRLLSENKGIDTMIRYVNKNPKISTLVLCGKEVAGHRAGHSLLCLHKYGIDNGRIVNSVSPDPILSVSEEEVAEFQKIRIVDQIGTTSLTQVRQFL